MFSKKYINKKFKTDIKEIDKRIEQYGNRDPFFVIQIGSNDGKTMDPIHQYIKQYNWKGILIEPVPYIFKRLKKTYKGFKGLIFENIAINKVGGYRTFYRIEKNSEPDNPVWYDQLGSFKKNVIEKHRNKIPNFYKHLICERVRCLSFSELLSKHSVSEIDLLHIDAEGYDYEIIKMIPFDKIPPNMILYEHTHLNQSDKKECTELLKARGYKLLATKEDTFAYK